MVTPASERKAVAHLVERHGMSERRACKAIGSCRMTMRYKTTGRIVFGRDQSVRGLLRVTLAPTLATHLLMPDFADFARLHPDIEMEILSSGELANLTNREADVAIRVVYDRKTLPLNLHGLKGPELFGGVYMSRDRLTASPTGAPDRIRWIVISTDENPGLGSRG